MQANVPEWKSGGEGSVDQTDCYPKVNNRSTKKIKGTPTRHREQPFEDPGGVVRYISHRGKERWTELWASPDSSVDRGCDDQTAELSPDPYSSCPRFPRGPLTEPGPTNARERLPATPDSDARAYDRHAYYLISVVLLSAKEHTRAKK